MLGRSADAKESGDFCAESARLTNIKEKEINKLSLACSTNREISSESGDEKSPTPKFFKNKGREKEACGREV